MKSIKDQNRQGDVLVNPKPHPEKLPPEVKTEDGRVILARGEATGHHHSFAAKPNVLLFRADEGSLTGYLKIDGVPSSLQHQEHGPIEHNPRTYRVHQQQQWTLAKQARRVAD